MRTEQPIRPATRWRRLTVIATLAGLSTISLMAQTSGTVNLVQNGSLEQLNKEPNTFDQLTRADGWNDVTIGLSDLFSKSASVKTVGIPDNFYGHMEPKEGAHYAGFFAWKDDKRFDFQGDAEDPFKPGWNAYSEYPWTFLATPLKEGHTYEVSFYVALAGNSDRAVAGIGAFFSPVELKYNNRMFLKERPQVVEDGILEKRGEWVEVKGRFKADGGERYLILGTFPTAIFDTKRIVEGPDNQFAYYYLDQIEVKEVEPE